MRLSILFPVCLSINPDEHVEGLRIPLKARGLSTSQSLAATLHGMFFHGVKVSFFCLIFPVVSPEYVELVGVLSALVLGDHVAWVARAEMNPRG